MNQSQKRQYVSAKRWAEKHDQEGRTALKIPSGWGFFKVQKTGTINLDFSYYIVGKGNPSADEGELYFERTYYCHGGVGANNATYLCPAKMSQGKRPCPICEDKMRWMERDDIDQKVKDEMMSKLKWKERQLFIVKDAKEKDAPWMIWDQSYYAFGKLLKTLLDEMPEDVNYDMFAHPEEGYTLSIIITEESFGAGKFKKAAAINFLPRKKPLVVDLDSMPCLDDLLIIPTYEQLKKVYFQLGDDEESPKSKQPSGSNGSAKKSVAPPVEDEDDDEEDEDEDNVPAKTSARQTKAVLGEDNEPAHSGIPEWCRIGEIIFYKGKECEVKRISKDGKTLFLEADDGDEFRGVDPKACKPYKEGVKEQISKSRVTEEDDEEDEEEEPRPRKRK